MGDCKEVDGHRGGMEDKELKRVVLCLVDRCRAAWAGVPRPAVMDCFLFSVKVLPGVFCHLPFQWLEPCLEGPS